MKKSAGCFRKQKLEYQIRLDPIRSKTGMKKAPSNKFSRILELPTQRRFLCLSVCIDHLFSGKIFDQLSCLLRRRRIINGELKVVNGDEEDERICRLF
ncbi:hypothetical protein MTR67_017083 [Solanum verrucosum]|uniref:Uncharacterized protein n=1 Tax=Solanum verrucosum TaxID=315347 RepID=A0AAF0QIC8_SOLVR|nr:hypothetical protein MTR67_017083 [Solanum verrucosum]